MTAKTSKNFAEAMKILEDTGLLLLQGSDIPDVCHLVAKRRINQSWWGDPLGPQIFAVSEMLSDHPDVTIAKLVSGKVTFVHRSLWQKLFAVGNARDDWQTIKLSAQGRLLLGQVDKEGALRTDKLGPTFGTKPGDVARELELRLLIHSEQFHTESGHHTKLLETWETWRLRMGLRKKSLESGRARNFFEKRVEALNKNFWRFGFLPWQAKKR